MPHDITDLEQEAQELAQNEEALANVTHSAALKQLDSLMAEGKVGGVDGGRGESTVFSGELGRARPT